MRGLLFLVLFFVFGTAFASEGMLLPPTKCGDFLKNLKLDRPDVVFDKCEAIPSGNPRGDTLEATYKVEGRNIIKVEKWLNSWAHTGKLRFLCCGWETKTVGFKGGDGAFYEIGMGGEATESSRSRLSKVPVIFLRVLHDTTEP